MGQGGKHVLLPLSYWSVLNHLVPLQLNKDIKTKKAAAEFLFLLAFKDDFLSIPSSQTFSYPITTDLFTQGRKEDAKNII